MPISNWRRKWMGSELERANGWRIASAARRAAERSSILDTVRRDTQRIQGDLGKDRKAGGCPILFKEDLKDHDDVRARAEAANLRRDRDLRAAPPPYRL